MTDRKIFDLFYGARENDHDMCRRAYETGADINFAFDGRRATKGGAGRWYYGDLQWYAPDGVDGDKKDTLLIIAVKTNNVKLVEWMLTLDGLDTAKENGKGLNAMAVAKAIGRENLLLGMAACDDGLPGGVDASAKSAASAADPNAPPLPPDKAAADEATMEVARLRTAMKMLKANNDEKEAKITKAQQDCQAYQQMLKEKDANIGELQKQVLEREKEVIVMLHKIGRLEEALREYTDFRQADAEQYTDWGRADHYDAENGGAGAAASAAPENGS
ncbi:hypothetical protein Esi_0089_0099 [Ectocarpus siliculosus]|uniref:Ankyrin repeat protein n=1 Tax=Ectocarpus siliculosus TaxID=2880 RepID=D7G8J3_ECTSI|nr:hypothetical protein Esi_0089_0099 [Ectocarpus siliculosus]|eukprot:CBJ28038.1 hypothetical protein Esi_0089_0099 [Ectocarpus siliculosus]